MSRLAENFRFPRNMSRSIAIRWKMFRQLLRSKTQSKRYLFIVGCQRSGTTMLSRILDKDLNTVSYGEASKLSYMDSGRRLRLRPLADIKDELERDRAPLIVLKPLVESQNTATLLHEFENSKAVWIYRHYKDVAASNIGRFGQANGINDLLPMFENHPDNWRSEKLSEPSRALVEKYFSVTMNPQDAAVLFWIVRNRIYFEMDLDTHADVFLCRYEDLTRNPSQVMKQIYKFVGQEYPDDQIVSGTHTKSIRKGAGVALTSEIESIATELLESLDINRGSGIGN